MREGALYSYEVPYRPLAASVPLIFLRAVLTCFLHLTFLLTFSLDPLSYGLFVCMHLAHRTHICLRSRLLLETPFMELSFGSFSSIYFYRCCTRGWWVPFPKRANICSGFAKCWNSIVDFHEHPFGPSSPPPAALQCFSSIFRPTLSKIKPWNQKVYKFRTKQIK